MIAETKTPPPGKETANAESIFLAVGAAGAIVSRLDPEHKHSLDVDFEGLLGENVDRTTIIAEVTSLIWNELIDGHEAWKRAESGEKTYLARLNFSLQTSKLMPVLKMLMDYAKNGKDLAEQIYSGYEAGVRS